MIGLNIVGILNAKNPIIPTNVDSPITNELIAKYSTKSYCPKIKNIFSLSSYVLSYNFIEQESLIHNLYG